MNKHDFLAQLRKGLSGLPQDDIEERLTFYGEMLDDRIEEGLSEEEAVSAIGDVEEIVRQAVADIPLAKIAKERIKPQRRLKAWEIVLLAIGSPIWLSLGVAAVAVILALYVSIWAIIVSLWAVFGAFAACAIVSLPECVIFAAYGSGASGLAILSAGIVCAGFSIMMFYGCKKATKGILMLTKRITIWVKNCFIKKEES
ncbi:MAG: DUF1700 domain-containing protein [Clostridia bacterium]|nr:DUF1700 domain-containing protein [Clostridia bacterium]